MRSAQLGLSLALATSSLRRLTSASRSASPPSPSPFPHPSGHWKSWSHRRAAVDSIGSSLGVSSSSLSSWYSCSSSQVRACSSQGGGTLLRYYQGSLLALLRDVYPEHAWDAQAFAHARRAPQEHAVTSAHDLASASHHDSEARSALTLYASEHSLDPVSPESWYPLTAAELRRHSAALALMLRRYHESVPRLVMAAYPSLPWVLPRFRNRPQTQSQTQTLSQTQPQSQSQSQSQTLSSKWKSSSQQRAFMDAIALRLGFDASLNPERWYSVRTKALRSLGVGGLLQLHALFDNKPLRYWADKEHQERYVRELGQALGIAQGEWEAWYRVRASEFRTRGGSGLLQLHGGSVAALLSAVYPQHTWDATRFGSVRRRYWDEPSHQRAFLERLLVHVQPSLDPKRNLGLHVAYALSVDLVRSHGGASLLQRFGGSVSSMLSALFPEHPWDPSLFLHKPQSFWMSASTQRSFLDSLARSLGFDPGSDYAQWYKVTTKDLRSHGGAALRARWNGSLAALLAATYPEHTWDPTQFKRASAAAARDSHTWARTWCALETGGALE